MDEEVLLLVEENSTNRLNNNDTVNKALGYPTLRQWELNENSTRWDRLVAAPSDEQLGNLWMGYSIAFFLFTAFNGVVFLSILCTNKKRETRSKPFNKYLLIQMFPDLVLTGLCAVNCALLAARGGYYGSWCRVQSFYVFWSVGASAYTQAIIAYEIHQLLVTKMRKRTYTPPSNRRILKLCGTCYLWAAFVAGWGIVPFVPTRTNSNRGLWCAPMEQNVASIIYWWLVYFPIAGGLPLAYTSYIAIWIWWYGLLPATGKRREISIFFFRIYAIFVVMWLPAVVAMFGIAPRRRGGGGAGSSFWPSYLLGLWAHATGAVSAGMALLKADIWEAFQEFVTCKALCCGDNNYCKGSHNSTPPFNNNNTASTMSPGALAPQPGSSNDHNHQTLNDNRSNEEQIVTRSKPTTTKKNRSGYWRSSVSSSTTTTLGIFAPKISLTLFPYYIGGYSVGGAITSGNSDEDTCTANRPSSSVVVVDRNTNSTGRASPPQPGIYTTSSSCGGGGGGGPTEQTRTSAMVDSLPKAAAAEFIQPLQNNLQQQQLDDEESQQQGADRDDHMQDITLLEENLLLSATEPQQSTGTISLMDATTATTTLDPPTPMEDLDMDEEEGQ